jgi:hypothetical protein
VATVSTGARSGTRCSCRAWPRCSRPSGRSEQDEVGGHGGRAEVFFGDHGVGVDQRRHDDEGRRAVKLCSAAAALGVGRGLQGTQRPVPEDAEAPGVGQVVRGRPAGEVEELTERRLVDRIGPEGLVRAARPHRVFELHVNPLCDMPVVFP